MGEREIQVVIGAAMVAVGVPLLFLPRLLYWYLDQHVRPMVEWGERIGAPAIPYKRQRELLRWLLPVLLIGLGLLFIVFGLDG